MLALVLAHPGPICDGLVALLGATPHVHKIVQIWQTVDALDFMETITPDIILIHSVPFTQEMAGTISHMKQSCWSPLLVIVGSAADQQTASALGADIVVIEGLPSAKLAAHISTLLQNYQKQKQFSLPSKESQKLTRDSSVDHLVSKGEQNND